MSFLLDALRKSEDRKHLKDVPTIYGTETLQSADRARRGYGPYVLLLLPAFLVLIWFGTRQFAATGDSPAESLSAVETPAAVESLPVEAPSPAITPAATPVLVLPGPGQSIGPRTRTPVETLVETAADTPPVEAVAAPDDTQAGAPEEAPAQPEAYQPPRPAVIPYWQLPESVRNELPEFRISVLVYAERPEDRFILLNGQRLLEGDSYQPGLVTEEIHRDGVEFSYRLYRFRVSR